MLRILQPWRKFKKSARSTKPKVVSVQQTAGSKDIHMPSSAGAVSPELDAPIAESEKKYHLDVPVDLGLICILACNLGWRKAHSNDLWLGLVVLGFGLSWFQLVVAILLFTGDSAELQNNLFVRGADNSRFLSLRALCMVLIFCMTFCNFYNGFKKILLHVFVLENQAGFILYSVALIANALKIVSTTITVMVSLLIIMSSPDSDGAIGIVMNFTALLIVAEIDDAVTPFVFNLMECFSVGPAPRRTLAVS